MSDQLQPPFTIRTIPNPWWRVTGTDRYEIVDMNGLCVAVHWHETTANELCVQWNDRFVIGTQDFK